ncbi:uncharacterized protein LY89DRAFT_737982 [Mollisia scopiformis]|uniref:Uncharacterized protein n=1 Tax=Mollisia scopiformis TaxID=149040 RepID=A0A194WYQ2_MOLSC|nr:uncharacterized protein LY89DRAFT_737982 [Mollisia scopiformis]KUJ13088.1 hypothetical protein LY89DRAFT_737982 [Mollisia scopiformis]
MFAFVTLLAAIFTSTVLAIPTQDQSAKTSPAISARDIIEYPIQATLCKNNPNDGNMCFISYVDNSIWVDPVLWVFDHNCVTIGYNGAVPRSEIEESYFGMSSELPDLVVIHAGLVFDDLNDIDFWYNNVHTYPTSDWGNIDAGWTENGVQAVDSSGTPWIWYRMAFSC